MPPVARAMKQVRFQLNIPAHRYIAYYQGVAKHVIVTAYDGTTVQFPAESLRPYLTHDGICGEFVLSYDEAHRLIRLEKLDGG